MKNPKHALALAVVLVLTLPLTPNTYAAEPPPGADLFGIYAGDNFNDDSSDENPTFVFGEWLLAPVYIYVTNVSAPSIGGFEFRLSYSGAGELPIMIDMGMPPGSISFLAPPDYMVGLSSPLLPDEYGHVILLSPTYFVFNDDPAYIAVTPITVPTVPDQISYVEFDEVSNIHAMNPASGNFVDPIFAINIDVVATENTTWTAVKAMYR